MNEILKQMVCRKCNITWDDPDTSKRVDEIIESAIPAMINKLGVADPQYDFSNPGIERSLFLSYCLYEWNHCVFEFDGNYLNDILQCRKKHTTEYYKEKKVLEDEQ